MLEVTSQEEESEPAEEIAQSTAFLRPVARNDSLDLKNEPDHAPPRAAADERYHEPVAATSPNRKPKVLNAALNI